MNETPLAMIRGQPLIALPEDLYIPPDALEVFLEAFEGPLDLLLYLIKKQNFDILDIPIAEITKQYMGYIELLKDLYQAKNPAENFSQLSSTSQNLTEENSEVGAKKKYAENAKTVYLELAAEYLVMAAMLAEIKSRCLLPKPLGEQIEEADPRAELVRRLQEYERIKLAAEELDKLPQNGRDIYSAAAYCQISSTTATSLPQVTLKEIMNAMGDIMRRAELVKSHQINRETISLQDRITHILTTVRPGKIISFADLFFSHEGRQGVVVTFIAILELLRQSQIEMFQDEPFGVISIKAVGAN